MSVASEDVTEQIVEKTKGPIDLTDEPLVEIIRDPASFISGPRLSRGGSIARNVLEFQKSYGFNCKRLFNLCLLVPDVLVFSSGNFIHFFTISTRTVETRRCSTGGGIGYITKNPNPAYNFLTVAENGSRPPIIIYRYPEMQVVALCESGAISGYTFVDYSADGEIMASQGAQPDFMITLWKWKSGTVILQTRSFQNTVHRVTFSLYNPGLLSTCGVGHIKFWKVCETFTGLKLVGEHGRFGKTEICDISAAYTMPLGSTISGSEWGNILVWEEGLIKFEVCRKNRQHCHAGAISELYLRDGEVMTVGRDGYVRIWFWETVDLADPPDDDLFVEIDPIYEYRIGSDEHECSLQAMVKRDEESWWWYAQDANGGLWLADISPENRPEPSQMLFRCHAGAIVSVAACPFDTFVATFGEDGRLHVYDYQSDQLVLFQKFHAGGRCMKWLPLSLDASGTVLLLGFDDGVVRLVCVDLSPKRRSPADFPLVKLVQVWKPHRLALTRMSMNATNTILVTGSEDGTLFVHQVVKQMPYVRFVPIGFVDIPSAATALNWKPNTISTLLVGCLHGQVLEMVVPERPRSFTEHSYKLTNIQYRQFVFKSRKSELRRTIREEEIKAQKLAKRKRKMGEMERLRKENRDIKIDEETFLADSDSDEELEPIYIPPIPNRVLWLQYTESNTVWLSMGKYDCGYVYDSQFDSNRPMECAPILDAEDLEINSYLYYDKYLVFGMQDGSVRINRVKGDYRDLSDYWSLTMHDNATGAINDMCVSYDQQYLFTVGADGNIFSYKWNAPVKDFISAKRQSVFQPQEAYVEDIVDPAKLSLEEQKQKDSRDARAMVANRNKDKVLTVINQYQEEFVELMNQNRKMIESQQIDEDAIVLDKRISDSLQASLLTQSQLVKRQLAFDLEKNRLLVKKTREYFIEPLEDLVTRVFALKSTKSVTSFRVFRLGAEFQSLVELALKMIQIEADSKRVIQVIEDHIPEVKTPELKRLESFLEVLSPSTIELRLGLQPSRLLKKYRARKEAERLSKEQWNHIQSLMPDINKNDPKDDAALKEAAATIGDYKLRTDPSYISTEEESSSVSKKYTQLLAVREKLGNIRSNFNREVFKMRRIKQQLTAYINDRRDHLYTEVHKEIEHHLREYPLDIDETVEHLEYPERAFDFDYRCDETPPKLEVKEQFNFFTYGLKQISIFISNQERYKTMEQESDSYSNLLIELIEMRKDERIFEQRQLMDDIEMRIRRFDQEIHSLDESRLEIEVAAKFLDVFLLTLYQELWVLRDFKQLEDKLEGKLNEKIMAQNELNAELKAQKKAIERHQKQIDHCEEDAKMLTQQFNAAATGTKFWDFLRKAYKRKLRVPKERDPDDEDVSSESSDESSSEEEDDDGASSRDSMDIGFVHIDESVCPVGCDRPLYDLTFELRRRRHAIEQTAKDEHIEIDVCKATIDKLTKQRKVVEVELRTCSDELKTYLRAKQKTLNEIDTLVILKMSQMQYFENADQFADIDQTILVNNDIINSLYNRVAEIELETARARQKHRANVVHLSRMKTDCKYMTMQMVKLREQYDIEMMKKFGMMVVMDELEEGILKHMVYNLRANTQIIQKEYNKKAQKLREEFASAQESLKCVVEQEIEKLNVLTVLQEEKNWLCSLERNRSRNVSGKPVDNIAFEADVSKLCAIAARQKKEIEILTNEINMLRLKAKNFDEINKPPVYIEKESRSHSGSGDNDVSSKTPEMTHSVTQFIIVNQVVEQFWEKYRDRIDAKQLNDISEQISIYFTSIASNLLSLSEQEDSNIQEIVQNIRLMIPVELWPNIAVANVAQLLQNLISSLQGITIQDHCTPEELTKSILEVKYTPEELVKSILEDTFDSITGNDSSNVQVLLTESMKNLIMSMSVEDIQRPECVQQLVKSIKGVARKSVTIETLHKEKVMQKVIAHGEENYVDEFSVDVLREVLGRIVDGLLEKPEE